MYVQFAMHSYLTVNNSVEFYFDDSNLPYDKFMWGLHTANEDHWVPIATISTFKRMKSYSQFGLEWLVQALREKAEILEVDEKGEMCRRTTEPKEITQQELLDRSVYAVSKNRQARFSWVLTRIHRLERFRRRASRIAKGAGRLLLTVWKSKVFTHAS